ncbi:MAG: hypothetical protein ACRCTE_08490 [Cellulosilyticaceae bacterium]
MWLGIEWYWWLVIVVGCVVMIPIKLYFLKKHASKMKRRDQSDDCGE